MRSKDQGFTILEMLAVLIILASAAFVLLIKLPINYEKEHLSFATTQLLEEIRDVRQAALAENDWYQIKFYSQTKDHYYQIFCEGTRIKEVHLKNEIHFLGKPDSILFNASGRSAGTTIVLTSPSGNQRSVVVAPVGMRIREK